MGSYAYPYDYLSVCLTSLVGIVCPLTEGMNRAVPCSTVIYTTVSPVRNRAHKTMAI